MVRRRRKRRSSRLPCRPAPRAAADQTDPIWADVCGRRMFVVGWTPGGAPYGIFEDEMDAGMNDRNSGECDQPY